MNIAKKIVDNSVFLQSPMGVPAEGNETKVTNKVAFEAFPVILDLGGTMLSAGADVHSVEEILIRMGHAYGAVSMDVIVITSVIIATMTLDDGKEYTFSRRVSGEDTNFYRLEAITRLANRICENPMEVDALQKEYDRIKSVPFSRLSLYVGGVLSTGGFALFFGGSILDAIVSAFFSLFICYAMKHLKVFTPNAIIFNFGISLIIGLLITLTSRYLLPTLSPDMVMIGDIMLLIPGVAISNAVRDMLSGDTISGAMRFIESCLWATALALGFIVAIWFGGIIGAALNPITG